jgi:ubiquinone/menaquinone biosynthesis C-methylase UbiE
MKPYYDVLKKRSINVERESCDIKTWKDDGNKYSCAKHDKGFYVFLSGDEISTSDEYLEKDPYTVIENLNSSFHRRRLNCTVDLLKHSSFSQNQKLLDLGCGQGHFTNSIKKHFPNCEVFGLDYSISAIDYAHSNFENIDFVVADAYHLPYPPDFFDVIVLNNIWEHVFDPLNLLKSISRVLKTSGQLIISTPSRYRLTNLIKVLLGRRIVFVSEHHVTEYTVGQVVEQLEFGGYKVSRIYSPPIAEQRVLLRIVKPILASILKALGSIHVLEATVFYLAIKLPPK